MKSTILSVDMLALVALFATSSLAAPLDEKRAVPVSMGAAKSFGGLAGTTLTSTGNTAITGLSGVGDGGAYPGTSITGFPPGTASGELGGGTVLAQNGQDACLVAYNNARAIPPTAALPSAILGGNTLPPGVYTFPTSDATLTDTLTLDAANNSAAQFIFQIDTTFAADAMSKIILKNKAQACNVYFIIGTSASIGAGAQLQGNFIAGKLIAAGEAASNQGTWCSLGAAVTLINNALVAQAGSCPT